MKILVTGGAGYIGSHMSRMLLASGYDVVVLDTLEFGHKEALPKGIELVVGNVADKAVVSNIFRSHDIDGVMHFAGYLSVEESVRLPIKYMQNNVIGPITLLEEMKLANVHRLIFSSTAAVYGNPLTPIIVEDHPKNPVSPYGLSKWAFEEMLHVYDRSFGIRSISLRYFNAAGASLDGAHGEVHQPETHVIPRAIFTALGQLNEFKIFGTDYDTPDGSALRDYIHVEDLCAAHVLALNALFQGHQSDRFNVGTGIGVSVKEIVHTIKKISGVPFQVTEYGRRSGDPARLIANPNKIQKELGWTAKYSDIETIVKSAFLWHKNHEKGYQ